MGSYTKISLQDAQEILQLYGLAPVRSLTPLSLGISNSNYRVELDDRKLLLKISNDKGQADLEREQMILQYLHAQRFPYSLCPIPTLEQQPVYQWGDYFGVLFPFVEGIPPGPSDITCREIGQGLARLHQVRLNPELRSHEEVGFGAQQISDFLSDPRCPRPFQEYFNQVFPDRLEGLIKAPLPRAIIHGDLYYDNTLFQHEHLGAMLDFEQSGIGEALLDIGISISGTCLEKGRLIPPLIHSYLNGYEQLRPLSREENQYLYDAINVGLFSIALWRIHRFKLGSLNPLMADSYLELLQRAVLFTQTVRPDELARNLA